MKTKALTMVILSIVLITALLLLLREPWRFAMGEMLGIIVVVNLVGAAALWAVLRWAKLPQ